MTIGAFITITRPYVRGDTYRECIEMANDLFDEVTIIDGRKSWPEEFSWDLIGQHFQKGYAQTNTDWVIHLDTDFIFHQKDKGKIRQALKDYPTAPAVSFYKWQFILPDRYNLKSRLALAVNKKAFGDRITFSGGGDLCQPQLDGKDLELSEIPQSGVEFYNYEKLIKTKAQIKNDVERMDRAYHTYFGKWLYSNGGRNAYKGWLDMVVGRFDKPSKHIPLSDHPKYIQKTIANLSPDQFGYNGLNNLPINDYTKIDMRG